MSEATSLVKILEQRGHARCCPSCQEWFAPGPLDDDGCSFGCNVNLREQARLRVRHYRWERERNDDN